MAYCIAVRVRHLAHAASLNGLNEAAEHSFFDQLTGSQSARAPVKAAKAAYRSPGIPLLYQCPGNSCVHPVQLETPARLCSRQPGAPPRIEKDRRGFR